MLAPPRRARPAHIDILCHAVGLTTADYSFGHVAHWAGGDPQAVKTTTERVIITARNLMQATGLIHGEADRAVEAVGPQTERSTVGGPAVTAPRFASCSRPTISTTRQQDSDGGSAAQDQSKGHRCDGSWFTPHTASPTGPRYRSTPDRQSTWERRRPMARVRLRHHRRRRLGTGPPPRHQREPRCRTNPL